MKKSHWIIVLLLIAGIGYVAASPLITINQIKSGIEEQDSEQLSENIDFPVLRQNMKEQFNAVMMKEAASELEDNPFGALAIGFASKLVDGMVDSFVTPSGLANLMEGKKPSKHSSGSSSDASTTKSEKRELFKNARYSYDSTSKFSVWVPNDDGEEIRFVIRRNGIEWKLANIVIPMDKKP
ncbi:MAG: DUF2939 domain-containing protein [Candidatus Cloacimonetes bacterium]|nr:DUF2939 domain-containing protein [Candidatus Cloacimonadota bacterium]MBT6217975.1 DUF2939 domain-containing protein [Candidatus Neomarinimicrobiota bacterium]